MDATLVERCYGNLLEQKAHTLCDIDVCTQVGFNASLKLYPTEFLTLLRNYNAIKSQLPINVSP